MGPRNIQIRVGREEEAFLGRRPSCFRAWKELPSQDRLQPESNSASQQRASTNEGVWCWEASNDHAVLHRLQWMLEGNAW